MVVGLGASAGGLEALRSFFARMPEGNGMAFVVVTHQLPGRVSLMQEETRRIVGALRNSPMSVFGQDAELRYEWVCSALYGLPPEQVLGRTDQELLNETDAAAVVTLKRQVIERGAPLRQRLHLSGPERSRLYDLFLAPQRDSAGAINGLSGVVTELQDGGE